MSVHQDPKKNLRETILTMCVILLFSVSILTAIGTVAYLVFTH